MGYTSIPGAYSGALTTTYSEVSMPNYWTVPISNVIFNKSILQTATNFAIFDLAIPYIGMPASDYSVFYEQLQANNGFPSAVSDSTGSPVFNGTTCEFIANWLPNF